MAGILGAYVTAIGTSADRFTGDEAAHMAERIRQMELRLATIPNQIPTTRVLAALERIEDSLDQLDNRIDELEQRLARLEEH